MYDTSIEMAISAYLLFVTTIIKDFWARRFHSSAQDTTYLCLQLKSVMLTEFRVFLGPVNRPMT